MKKKPSKSLNLNSENLNKAIDKFSAKRKKSGDKTPLVYNGVVYVWVDQGVCVGC